MSSPEDTGAKDRPFVLQPYAVDRPPLWRRAIGWAIPPTLVFVCLLYGFFYALTAPYLIPQFVAPIIILAALAVWALPDLSVAPTRTMEFVFFGFLAAELFWPGYLAVVLPGLPWITPIRLTGFPLAFLLLICVSTSRPFRTRVAEILRAVPGLWQLTTAFCVLAFLSVIWSTGRTDSINRLVDTQVGWTSIFFVSCYVFTRKGRPERWAYFMFAAAIYSVLIGFAEAKLGHVPWAGHIPSFLKVDDAYVQTVLGGAHRLGTDKYRVEGTHSTSLGLAEILALTTPFVLYFIVGPYKVIFKLIAAASLPFIFFTIYQTDARLGMVGFFMSCLLYLLTWGLMRWRNLRQTLLGPAVVLSYPAVFVTFMTATFFVQRLKKLVWGGSNDKYSNQGRSDQWAMGLPKLAKHPWGFGVGRGGEELGYHNLGGVLTIDTYYLLVALDYGVIGFFLYYGTVLLVLGSSAWNGLMEQPRDREEGFLVPIAISLSVFFLIKSVFSQAENHPLIYMMMGMAAALIWRMKNPDVAESAKPTAVLSGQSAG